MQEAGRIGTPVDLQFVVARLERLAQREHAAFGRQVIALQQIAVLAGRQDILPCRRPAAGFRDQVVKGQLMRFMLYAAILARPLVAQEYVKSCKSVSFPL